VLKGKRITNRKSVKNNKKMRYGYKKGGKRMLKSFRKVLAVTLALTMLLSVGFVGVTANNGDWRDNPDLLMWDDFTRGDLRDDASFDAWYAEYLYSIGGGQEFVLAVPLRDWLTDVSNQHQAHWVFQFVSTGNQTWAPFTTFYQRWSRNWVDEWLSQTNNGATPEAWDRTAQLAWLLIEAERSGSWVNADLDHVTLWSAGARAQAVERWVDLWEVWTVGGNLYPSPNDAVVSIRQLAGAGDMPWIWGIFPAEYHAGINAFRHAASASWDGGALDWWASSPRNFNQVSSIIQQTPTTNAVNAWLDANRDVTAEQMRDIVHSVLYNVAPGNGLLIDVLELLGESFMELSAEAPVGSEFHDFFASNPTMWRNDSAIFAAMADALDALWATANAPTVFTNYWRALEQDWYNAFEAIPEATLRTAFRAARFVNNGRLGNFNVMLNGEPIGPAVTNVPTGSTGFTSGWMFPTENWGHFPGWGGHIPLTFVDGSQNPIRYGNLATSGAYVTGRGAVGGHNAGEGNQTFHMGRRMFDMSPSSPLYGFTNTGILGFEDNRYLGFVDEELWFSVQMRYIGTESPRGFNTAWIGFGTQNEMLINTGDGVRWFENQNSPMLAVGFPSISSDQYDATPRVDANWWAMSSTSFDHRIFDNSVPTNDQFFGAPIVPNQDVLVVIHFNLRALGSDASPFDGSGLTPQRAAVLGYSEFWDLYTANEAQVETITGFITHQANHNAPNAFYGLDITIIDALLALRDDFSTAAVDSLVEYMLAPAEALGWSDGIDGYDQMSLRNRATALIAEINSRTIGADIVTVFINPDPDSLGGEAPVVADGNMIRFEFAPHQTWLRGTDREVGKFRADTLFLSSRDGNTLFGDIRFGATFASVTPVEEAPSLARIVVEDDYVTGVVFAPNAVTSANPTIMIATFETTFIGVDRFIDASVITSGLEVLPYTGNAEYRFIDLSGRGISVPFGTAGQRLQAFVWNSPTEMRPMTRSQLVWSQ